MPKLFSGAEIVFKCLEDQDVSHIFGYPGGAVLPIYDELKKTKKDNCSLVTDLDNLSEEIFKIVKSGDMVLTMGAGSIWRYCDYLYDDLLKQK